MLNPIPDVEVTYDSPANDTSSHTAPPAMQIPSKSSSTPSDSADHRLLSYDDRPLPVLRKFVFGYL